MIGATLFSGIGAPEQAMPHWDWRWHAEIEPFPSAVMAVRHPQSVNLGDVSAEDFYDRAAALGRPDVLVFGSPCQSFSVAGKRLGLDDPRGNLALVALGIIARLRPAWFVFENVPGLLSSADGRDFGLFLRTVDDLGYHLAWRVLDAQYAGVAQRRRRVFAVGHTRDWRRAAAVLLEPDRLCGHPPTRGEAREDVTGTLASRTSAGGGLGTDFDLSGGLVPERERALTTSIQRLDSETETFIPVSHALRGEGFDASEDGIGRGTPIVPTYFQDDATIKHGPIVGALRRDAGGQGPCIAFRVNDYGADTGTPDQSPTLRRNGVQGVQGVQGVRRLTPVECERLQGMADNYTAITYRGKPAKDEPRYRAIGNSMAVPVIRWILERIAIVEAL